MRTTQYEAAFNDIGLVDLEIRTPMGTLNAGNMGPNDVVISAQPGNDGNVMNIFEGSTGQLVANKSYKVRNWNLTVRFLRHSLDYCRGTYLIQEILNGNITAVGIKLTNTNFGNGEQDTDLNEILESDQAFLVNFEGLEAGAGASGDFTLQFKLSDAKFISGVYTQKQVKYADWNIPANTRNGVQATGIDKYEKSADFEEVA